jgi:hypothetical protein
MVEFSRYVQLAYEVADEKGVTPRGPGSQDANRQFMSMLADEYNARNHSEASESQARQFLREAIQ